MKKVRLDIIALSSSEAHAGHFALILEEVSGNRRLPIIIGAPEAQAIALEVENIRPNRPMTHDLIFNICEQFSISLSEVVIIDLKEGIFHARLVMEHEGKIQEVDSRPSDAIAIAVRFKVPIYTTEKILQEAGIVVKENDGEGVEELEELSDEQETGDSLNALNEKLEEALRNEDYEAAARIRDSIQKFNEK